MPMRAANHQRSLVTQKGFGKKPTVPETPKVEVKSGIGDGAPSRLHVGGTKQGQINQHGALEQIAESPLNLVVDIPSIRPRGQQAGVKILEGSRKGCAGGRAGITNPSRIDLQPQIVATKLADQPAQHRHHHRRENEAAGPSKDAFRYPRQRSVDLTRPDLLGGLQSVHEAGQNCKDGDARATHKHAPHKRQLEDDRRQGFGHGRRQEDACEGEDDVRVEDDEGGDAFEALLAM